MKAKFEKLVDFFGSQSAAAKALGVKQGSVSGWVRGLHGMSPIIALRAEAVTQGAFKAVELCPELLNSAA